MKEIENRHSIRKYTNVSVSKQQIEQLLRAAMMAPSACNSRPWEFVVVTNRQILEKIPSIVPNAKMLGTAAAAIIVVALPQTGRPEGYFPQDCAAATQNILLEAVSMGLGTCWCGVYPHEEKVTEMGKLLNVSAPKLVFNVIALGVPDENPPFRGIYEPSRVTYLE